MICACCQLHYIPEGVYCERCLKLLDKRRNDRLAYITYAKFNHIPLIKTECKIHGIQWNARFPGLPECPSCYDIQEVRLNIIAQRPKGYAE
jgi:hypothetical protein